MRNVIIFAAATSLLLTFGCDEKAAKDAAAKAAAELEKAGEAAKAEGEKAAEGAKAEGEEAAEGAKAEGDKAVEAAKAATPNFDITRKYFTAYHEKGGDAALLNGFIDDAMKYHVPGGKVLDAAATKGGATKLRDSLDGVKVTLALIKEEGDTVDFTFTYEGTKKEGGEASKTGPVPIRYKFANGKVVEGWMAAEIPGFTK